MKETTGQEQLEQKNSNSRETSRTRTRGRRRATPKDTPRPPMSGPNIATAGPRRTLDGIGPGRPGRSRPARASRQCADGRMMAGTVTAKQCCSAHRGSSGSRSAPRAAITAPRTRGSRRRDDHTKMPSHPRVLGLRTGQVNACTGPSTILPRLGRRGSKRHRKGGRRAQTGSASRPPIEGARVRPHRRRRRGRQSRRRPFGAKATRARSPSWTPIRTPRMIGPTSPRTTWPATRRKSGSRCIRPGSTRRRASS